MHSTRSSVLTQHGYFSEFWRMGFSNNAIGTRLSLIFFFWLQHSYYRCTSLIKISIGTLPPLKILWLKLYAAWDLEKIQSALYLIKKKIFLATVLLTMVYGTWIKLNWHSTSAKKYIYNNSMVHVHDFFFSLQKSHQLPNSTIFRSLFGCYACLDISDLCLVGLHA